MKSPNILLPIAATVALALGACGEGAPDTPPAPIPAMSPEAARLVITSGFDCTVSNPHTSGYRQAGGEAHLFSLTAIDVDFKVNQTPESLAAQKQYGESSAVLWRFVIGTEVFHKDPATGVWQDQGMGMANLGSWAQGERTLEVPTAATDKGDAVLTYSLVSARTGEGADANLTIARKPCGTYQLDEAGSWRQVDMVEFGTAATYHGADAPSVEQHSFSTDGLVYPR